MPQDDSPQGLEEVEVSVGWQSSPPARAMLDRPSSSSRLDETPQRDSNSQTPLAQKRPASAPGPVGSILGKYSELLPGSSPPMPRLKIRKQEDSVSITRPLFQAVSQIPTPGPELSDDSDLEDLMSMQPAEFVPSFFKNRRVVRLVVQSSDATPTHVKLHCTNMANEIVMVSLLDSWMRLVPQKGDMVHVIGDDVSGGDHSKPLEVTDSNGRFLVANPDILVPCTSIAESMSCERQIALRSRVRVPSEINEHTVLGTLRHELIQECLMLASKDNPLRAFEKEMMAVILDRLLDSMRLDLYLVGLDVVAAKTEILELVPLIQEWANSIFGPNGLSIDTHRGQGKLKVKLQRTAMVEEEIRSPYWGLVGKPDVTVDAIDMNGRTFGSARLAGLEIKTGKNTGLVGHRAQTSLYTLLLAERHPKNTHPWSLLYYTTSGVTIAVTSMPTEVRALIQQRNILAQNMWRLPDNRLPSPAAASEKSCSWCSRKNSCGVYTATVDNGNTWGSPGLSGWYNKAVEAGTFVPRFLEFAAHWNALLDLEYEVCSKPTQMRSRQWWLSRADSLLFRATNEMSSGTPGVHIYEMTALDSNESAKSISLAHNDRLVVSTKQHMGVAFGLCLESSPSSTKIAVSGELLRSVKYRLDAEVWSQDAHLGLARNNIVSLLDADRLRELVVDLIAPQFAHLSTKKLQTTANWVSGRVLPTPSQSDATKLDASLSSVSPRVASHLNLNEDQTAALNKVLGAKDYALILGMPGTGKTTTIAAIVATLVERGHNVLISGYTNSAVDTIVLKLISANVECLRLGSDTNAVHQDVQTVSATAAEISGQYEKFLEAPVVACTSHYVNHKLFALRKFDYCIVDEASQITLPFCLGPLRLASKFVLVGDHYQLPPLVRNPEAKSRGLDASLFKILCEAHPCAVAELTKQYRMCKDIMSLSSELIYGGRLVCGTEQVAQQKLDLPTIERVDPFDPLLSAIEPANHVVFINTDTLGELAFEHEVNGGVSNLAEAGIVESLVQKLAVAGLDMHEVAVISVYRRQLAQLRELLNHEVKAGLEILTADQAQGRDKRCILVSLVRSNPENRTGELLKDWRRLNVAFTRAKQKLIIVGSRHMMKEAHGVARFFDLMEQRGWVQDAQMGLAAADEN